jgi:hypothetical protein
MSAIHKPARGRFFAAVLASMLALGMPAATAANPEASPPDNAQERAEVPGYTALVALFDEFIAWRNPAPGPDGFTEYGRHATDLRVAELARMHERLAMIDPAGWSRGQQADYLAVRAQLDEQEFMLRVTRPWQRDPVFYVNQMLQLAFTELPVRSDALATFRAGLRALPLLAAHAQANLTAITRDHGELGIFYLTTSDGVGNQHPYRQPPPAGVIGWYDDLLGRAEAHQPELAAEIRAAGDAARGFHDWLVSQRDSFVPGSGVGEELFDWYIRNALLIPHGSAEILAMTHREHERLRAFHALERHRNRELAELELAASEEEYHRRLAATDARVRAWLADEEFISVPDFIPGDWQVMGFNVPWIDRGAPPNYWEQIQYRDPAPDHLHAVIPGHRYDQWFERHSTHPIRRHIRDGVRYQGWAVYLEETPLQLGLYDNHPRTRELIYLFMEWRAARTIGDIHNQHNTMTLREVMDYWLESTPYMDESVARNYAYLRPAPGHGLHYTYGHMQMRRLLADAQRQQGAAFTLRDFHDRFMAAERIPISLIRYEMTGHDDEISGFWARPPLAEMLP